MWNEIKSYFKFCGLALAQDYHHSRWYRLLSATYVRANKIANYALGTTTSALVILGVYSYRATLLSNKRWVAIVTLSLVVVFLLWLIGVVKRYHERTLNEITLELGRAMEDMRAREERIHELTLAYGMALEASHLIEVFHDVLPQDRLKHLQAYIHEAMLKSLGAEERDRFLKWEPPLPDRDDAQKFWIGFHCNNLRNLLIGQRGQQFMSRTQVMRTR